LYFQVHKLCELKMMFDICLSYSRGPFAVNSYFNWQVFFLWKTEEVRIFRLKNIKISYLKGIVSSKWKN
jgi:hypothetical protein